MRSFILTFIFATLCLVARPPITVAQTSTRTIRQQIATINHTLPRLKKIEKEVTGTDEGGYLVAWRDDKGFVKIVLWLGLSIHNQEMSYYFHQGRLIAMQEQYQYFVWDETKEILDRRKPGKRKTAAYYFQHRRLIKYAGAGQGRTAASILGDASDALRLASARGKSLSINDF